MHAASTDTPPQVSLVVPIRNEAGNIGPLIREITHCLDGSQFDWELLVIDDGSTDESATEVAAAAATDRRVRCLQHHRPGEVSGFGHGLRHCPRRGRRDA